MGGVYGDSFLGFREISRNDLTVATFHPNAVTLLTLTLADALGGQEGVSLDALYREFSERASVDSPDSVFPMIMEWLRRKGYVDIRGNLVYTSRLDDYERRAFALLALPAEKVYRGLTYVLSSWCHETGSDPYTCADLATLIMAEALVRHGLRLFRLKRLTKFVTRNMGLDTRPLSAVLEVLLNAGFLKLVKFSKKGEPTSRSRYTFAPTPRTLVYMYSSLVYLNVPLIASYMPLSEFASALRRTLRHTIWNADWVVIDPVDAFYSIEVGLMLDRMLDPRRRSRF